MGRGAHMRLGMYTACLPNRTLDEIAAWAADAGHQALEVAAWPNLSNRPFVASHLPDHEDPLWGGTEDKIETGMRVAHRTLRPLVVA
jgi:hypothetical protein